MRMLIKPLLGLSFLCFLVGVSTNLLELTSEEPVTLLWPALAWWRAAIYLVALSMALILKEGPAGTRA